MPFNFNAPGYFGKLGPQSAGFNPNQAVAGMATAGRIAASTPNLFTAIQVAQKNQQDRAVKQAVIAQALAGLVKTQQDVARTNQAMELESQNNPLKQDYMKAQIGHLQEANQPVPVYNYDAATGKTTPTGEMMPRNAKLTRQGAQMGSKVEDIDQVVSGIASGELNPNIETYSFKDRTAIASHAKNKGVNLNKLTSEYKAVNKFIQTRNSAKQVAVRAAIDSVTGSLGNLRELNAQFKRTGWTPANKAELALALSGTDPTKRDIATRYNTTLIALQDELGQAFMGGNSPTDKVISMAQKLLNSNYGFNQLSVAIDELDKNLNYRKNAMDNGAPVGVGGEISNSRYYPDVNKSADSHSSDSNDFSSMSDEELRKIAGL